MDFLRRVWRIGRWIVLVVVILFAVLVIYRWPVVAEREKTQEVVAQIHAAKLTMEDVFGALPPEPDAALNNATLAGIDSNNNGIRDDVERAIYFAHKDSARVTAAEYQYAKALQHELNGDVFNSDTLVAVIQEEGRGYLCVSKDSLIKETESFVFNTKEREQFRETLLKKYMTSYKLINDGECDIDPQLFVN